MTRRLPIPFARAAAAGPLAVCLFAGAAGPAAAQPALGFSSWAQTYGYVNAQYSSPLLGDVSFTLNGPSDYRSNGAGSGATTTGVAAIDYAIAPGQGGTDPVYDIVTTSGQYGFGYSGRAEVDGLALRTRLAASTIDASGQTIDYAPNGSVYGYAYASWTEQMYIGATSARAAGSYGAILVGITFDGTFAATGSPATLSYAASWISAQASFTDVAGGTFQNSYSYSTGSYDPSWTGSLTVYKKLLFQFGTPFDLTMYQYAYASTNGEADFFDTGRITSIEIPFDATLYSGAEQAGLGSQAQLYGAVTQSATADDINTNWDFGNNGGGYVPPPPVPEPPPQAMLWAGLAVLGLLARRRRTGR